MNEQSTLPTQPEKAGVIKQYFRDLILLMSEPRAFFKNRYAEMSLIQGLTFGIVSNWLATFFEWLTRQVTHRTFMSGFQKIQERLSNLPFWNNIPDTLWTQGKAQAEIIPNWLAELTNITISPFQALIKDCVYGTIIALGAYLLIHQKEKGGRDKVEISNFIKLFAISTVPYLLGSILGFLPFDLNNFISWIYSVAILIIGISTRYRVSTLRSFVIVILPGFFGVIAVGCLIGGTIGMFILAFAALFGSR
jgi:hypothetical protein